MQNHLIKVARFNSSLEANLIKGILENESIFSRLSGEYINQVLPLVGETVYLEIFENDLIPTSQILDRFKGKFNFEKIRDIV